MMKGLRVLIQALEENNNHVPAGSPAGGQFAKGSGVAGGGDIEFRDGKYGLTKGKVAAFVNGEQIGNYHATPGEAANEAKKILQQRTEYKSEQQNRDVLTVKVFASSDLTTEKDAVVLFQGRKNITLPTAGSWLKGEIGGTQVAAERFLSPRIKSWHINRDGYRIAAATEIVDVAKTHPIIAAKYRS